MSEEQNHNLLVSVNKNTIITIVTSFILTGVCGLGAWSVRTTLDMQSALMDTKIRIAQDVQDTRYEQMYLHKDEFIWNMNNLNSTLTDLKTGQQKSWQALSKLSDTSQENKQSIEQLRLTLQQTSTKNN